MRVSWFQARLAPGSTRAFGRLSRLFGWLTAVLLLSAIASFYILLVGMPAPKAPVLSHTDPTWPRTLWRVSPFLFGILSLVLANQCYVSSIFLSRAASEASLAESEELLPSRQKALGTLRLMVDSCRPDDPAQTIVMPGPHGQGKTAIIRALVRDLQVATSDAARRVKPSRVILVRSDIWAEASEPDLHFALFEGLLSSPGVLRVSWLGLLYPPLLGPFLLVRHLLRMVRRQRMMLRGITVRLDLPTMLWQTCLARTIARARNRKHRIIWILDELDRAAPETAQAALALMRRSLSLPGVTVLLPFVEHKLSFIAFHPVMAARADLAGGCYADLYHSVMKKASAEGPLADFFNYFKPLESLNWTLQELAPQGWTGELDEPDWHLPTHEAQTVVRRRLAAELIRHHLTLQGYERKQLLKSTSEKYLDVPSLPVPDLERDDVPALLERVSLLAALCGGKAWITALLDEGSPDEGSPDPTLRVKIENSLPSPWPSSMEVPTPRRLIARICELLVKVTTEHALRTRPRNEAKMCVWFVVVGAFYECYEQSLP